MEHKITTEKIVEAASKCSQAKETLKILFPEAFKEDKHIFIDWNNRTDCATLTFGGSKLKHLPFGIAVRTGGEFAKKGIYLDNNFNWEVIKDRDGVTVLVPTRKAGIINNV